MPAKRICSWFLIVLAAIVGARAQPQPAQVTVNFTNGLGPLEIHKMALGQGGLSDRPMWEDRITEIRSLKPAINDENLRLRPRSNVSVKKGEHTMRADFEAYGLQLWMFE